MADRKRYVGELEEEKTPEQKKKKKKKKEFGRFDYGPNPDSQNHKWPVPLTRTGDGGKITVAARTELNGGAKNWITTATRTKLDGGTKNYITMALRAPAARGERRQQDREAEGKARPDGDLPQLRHRSCLLLRRRQHWAIKVRFEFWFFRAAL
ncbi:hypothetical protein TIFTF001_012539 [Ficus carica]|uniref:Uncharacterized protein n=1 Tax=Ficus carica TaxID=3494 RepID=A0AA87ZW38_FICCA|nr:hypothetical protein TIFTF001_012539 [Ficus carica]